MNLGLLLVLELILQLGAGRMILPPSDETGRFIEPSRQTHHDYVPGAVFVRRPNPEDSFAPLTIHINSAGIRGPEIGPRRGRRILNLGDSYVQGIEVAFEETFGERLNGRFGPDVEFISHGVSSWAPTTEFAWLHHRGLALKPDEVNLFLCVNDFFRAATYAFADETYRSLATVEAGVPVAFDVRPAPKPAAWKTALKKIELVRLGAAALRSIRGGGEAKTAAAGGVLDGEGLATELTLLDRPRDEWPEDLRTAVDGTLDVVVAMHRKLRAEKIAFRVALVPTAFAWANENVPGKTSPYYGWAEDHVVGQAGLESFLRERLSAAGIPFIDLGAAFDRAKTAEPDRLLFYERDGHWNAAGHRVVFEALLQLY